MRIKLAYPITESELLFATGAQAKKLLGITYTHISTDTRELKEGDLYIGLPGEHYSDTDFIGEAKGVGAITISSSNLGDYTTKEPRKVPLRLAEYYKTKLTKLIKTVAITGSYGKTTTKSFLCAILQNKFKIHSTPKNYNNDIGLPMTILSAPAECEVLILECGTSERGEIKALAKCARPDIAIITSIGTSHIASFGTRENIAREKLDILSFASPLLIRPDNEPLLAEADGISVGEKWYHANSISPVLKNSELWLEMPSTCIKVPFTNNALLTPLMLSIAAAVSLGLGEKEISNGVSRISSEDLRYKIIHFPRYSIIDDAYNASPETILGAVDNLLTLSAKYHSALIGDVYELGEHTEYIHRSLGRELGKRKISRLFLYGNYIAYTLSGLLEHRGNIGEIVLLSGTVGDLAKHLDSILLAGELLLIKGSHSTGLHKLSNKLKELNE